MSPTPENTSVIEIKGLDALLRRIDKAPVKKLANKALAEATKAVHKRLSGYTQTFPIRRPGQKYVRTFTLKGSIVFAVQPFGTSGEGRVSTALGYAPYVMGHDSQSRVHAGRWWTDQSVAEEMTPTVVDLFAEAADGIASAIAGTVI